MSINLKNIKKNKVLKAGIGYTIGNYLLKGINFLTIPIFTRLMSTSDYGTYSIYMTYNSIISVFIAFALHSSINNAKYKFKEKYEQYISSILILPIMFLSGLLILVNLFGTRFEAILDLNNIIINILLIHSFANAIVQIYNSKLSVDYKYQGFLKLSFVNTLLNLALSLVLIYFVFESNKCVGRIIGSAVPLFIIAIYIYIKSFRCAKPVVNFEYWKFGLNYSLPIIPHGLAQIVLSSFDRIMIKTLVGYSQAGIYSLGCNIEQLVKITTTSIDTVWSPWFYEQMNSGNEKKIKKMSYVYIYGIFLLLTCLILATPELVWFMGSKEYQDAKYIVIPLLSCTFFTFLYTLPATVEYYYQKTKMIAIGTIGAAILNIILNSVFIRSYGYQAAAYTTLVSYFAYFVFHYNIAKKIHGSQIYDTKFIMLFVIGIIFFNFIGIILMNYSIVRFIVLFCYLMVNAVIVIKKIIPFLKAN